MRGHVQEQSRRNHKGARYRALRGLCSPEKAWGLGRKFGKVFLSKAGFASAFGLGLEDSSKV